MTVQINFDVDAAIAKLGQLSQEHGPQAVNLAAQVVQVNAINTLTGIPAWGAVTAAALYGCHWCFRRFEKVRQGGEYDEYDAPLWLCGIVPFGIGALIGFTGFMYALFDVWAWVALFNPKLALAHEVFAKIAGS